MCREDIPYAGNGSEARNVSWSSGRHPGAVVNYTCPTGQTQIVTCADGGWQPPVLPTCGESGRGGHCCSLGGAGLA